MEWLTSLFSGPYPAIPPAAIAVPLALGIVAFINRDEKERNRKGWHPVTKAALWVFGSLLALCAVGWTFT